MIRIFFGITTLVLCFSFSKREDKMIVLRSYYTLKSSDTDYSVRDFKEIKLFPKDSVASFKRRTRITKSEFRKEKLSQLFDCKIELLCKDSIVFKLNYIDHYEYQGNVRFLLKKSNEDWVMDSSNLYGDFNYCPTLSRIVFKCKT